MYDKITAYKTKIEHNPDGVSSVHYDNIKVVEFDSKSIEISHYVTQSGTILERANQTSRQFDLGFVVEKLSYGFYVKFGGRNIKITNMDVTLDRSLKDGAITIKANSIEKRMTAISRESAKLDITDPKFDSLMTEYGNLERSLLGCESV